MLRCVSRYRNAQLAIFVEPGEVLSGISAEIEAQLLRDSPGSFEVLTDTDATAALDAPPRDKMLRRESTARKASERDAGEVMSEHNMPGLVPPRGDKPRLRR